jgi:hypothetical protein
LEAEGEAGAMAGMLQVPLERALEAIVLWTILSIKEI